MDIERRILRLMKWGILERLDHENKDLLRAMQAAGGDQQAGDSESPPPDPEVIAFDLERTKHADRVFDTGRIASVVGRDDSRGAAEGSDSEPPAAAPGETAPGTDTAGSPGEPEAINASAITRLLSVELTSPCAIACCTSDEFALTKSDAA